MFVFVYLFVYLPSTWSRPAGLVSCSTSALEVRGFKVLSQWVFCKAKSLMQSVMHAPASGKGRVQTGHRLFQRFIGYSDGSSDIRIYQLFLKFCNAQYTVYSSSNTLLKQSSVLTNISGTDPEGGGYRGHAPPPGLDKTSYKKISAPACDALYIMFLAPNTILDPLLGFSSCRYSLVLT